MSRIAVLNIVFTAVSTTSSTFARVGGAFSEVCCATAGVIATDWVRTAGSNSRRANASRAHATGLSVGSPGPLDAANGLTAWMNRVNSPVTTLVASGGFGFDGVSTNDVAVNEESTPLIWTGVVSTSTGSEECAIAAEGSRETVSALASGSCRPPAVAVAGAECPASADWLVWVRDRLEAWGVLVGGADSSSSTSPEWTAASD
jgi:hypothetical protein